MNHASRLLGHHDLDKLFVVNLSVTIDISLTDHLIDFLVGELLAKVGHDVTKLSSGDETVAILVENLEGLLGIGVLHLASHQVEELWEIDGSGAISINLVDHVLELSLSWVLAEGTHDGSKLLGGNGTITILVEQGECLLELGDLLFGKLVSHVVSCESSWVLAE